MTKMDVSMLWEYAAYEYVFAVALLVTATLGMGTTLSVNQFVDVARRPRGVLSILALQLLITPLLAIFLARALAVPTGVAIGMLLIAALPGGSYSNLITYVGRGNTALSVSATAICTLLCLLTTPLVLRTFGAGQLPSDFRMPVTRILSEIAGCVVVPLLVGMTLRRFAPLRARTIGKWSIRAALLILAVLIVSSVVSGRLQLGNFGWRPVCALFLFGFCSLWICYGVCYALRFSTADTFTIAVEVVVRNGNLGLLLKASLFPAAATGYDLRVADGVLYAVLVYAFISLAVAIVEIFAKRMGQGIIYRGEKHATDTHRPHSHPARRRHSNRIERPGGKAQP